MFFFFALGKVFDKRVLDHAAPGGIEDSGSRDKERPDAEAVLIQHAHQKIKAAEPEEQVLKIDHQAEKPGL